MSRDDHAQTGPLRATLAARLVAVVSAAAMILIMARVAFLQLVPDERLEAQTSGHARLRVDMPRGDLLDRQGRLLAASRFAWQTIVDPTLVPSPPDAWIAQLADAIGEPADAVGARVLASLAVNDQRTSSPSPATIESADLADEAEAYGAVLDRLLARLSGDEQAEPESIVEADGEQRPRPRRYLPVGPLLDRDQADRVSTAGLRGVSLERRSVRVTSGDADLASIVGKVGFGHKGLLGVERSLDGHLAGTPSRLRAVTDARGRPLWIERGSFEAGRRGDDIRLSFDRVLQAIAHEELSRGVEDADAAGGRLVAVDPETGEVLAMVDILRDVPAVEVPWRDREPAADDPDPGRRDAWRGITEGPVRPRFRVVSADPRREVHPALGRNRCLEDIYEPGSTFKAFIWTTAYEAGLLTGDGITTSPAGYRTPYGRQITDVTRLTTLTWDDVLLHSSNIGMVKISEMMSRSAMRAIVLRFGFGRQTGLPLPGETAGLVTSANAWDKYSQTSIAMGYEIGVTPVQMVRAFSALARNGDAGGTVPALTMTALETDAGGAAVERVLRPETVVHARRVLAGVVDRMDAQTARRYPDDPEPTFDLFGKSGTAKIPMTPPPGKRRPRGAPGYYDKQYNSSFIAAGPVEHPRLVVLVVIDDPGPALVRRNEYYGSSVAGPVVRRFSERALRYLGVEPTRESEPEPEPAPASQDRVAFAAPN